MMRLKTILLVLIGFSCFTGISQSNNGFYGMSLRERNILTKDYDNRIKVSHPGGLDTLLLKTDSKTIIKQIDSNTFKIRIHPENKNRSIKISSFGIKGKDTLELTTMQFRIIPMPNPNVFIGGLNLSKHKEYNDSTFFAIKIFFLRFTKDIPLSASFKLNKFEVIIEGKKYTNYGATLKKHLLEKIKLAQKHSIIEFKNFDISGPFGKRIIELNYRHRKTSESGDL